MPNGARAPTLLFIPGWLMPAEVFRHQWNAFSDHYRVVVLDPRSQGQSALHRGSDQAQLARARARDIHELIRHLGIDHLVLIGWSLGVMEGLDCLRLHGVAGLRGLVLIDNSIGEGPPPAPRKSTRPRTAAEFDRYIDGFVQAMIRNPEDEETARIVRSSALRLRKTPARAFDLLAKPWPREIYRDTLYTVEQPVWYAITPRYREQASLLSERHPNARVTIYEDATHAIFIDQPARFNDDLRAFLESVA